MKRLSTSTSTFIRVASLATVLALTACSTTKNETVDNMPVDKLYAQAKEEAGAGSFEQAIKLYEKLEGRAAGSLLAQQAMLEQAYLHHRNGDKAQALSVLERFSRVHPSSPATDYALYLRGIINFNDNLGLLAKLAQGQNPPKAAPEGVVANVDKYWNPAWKTYGTVDGTFYAAPLGRAARTMLTRKVEEAWGDTRGRSPQSRRR